MNDSFQTSEIPSQLIESIIAPIFKGGDRTTAKNYRPVALLCVLSKILEKAVAQQIVAYLENNSIFHPSHHGFRSLHSTCTALLEIHHSWLRALDQNEFVATLMLDLSAAFDVVDHSLLLEKFSIYGFDGISINWFKSYLTGRKQLVQNFRLHGHIY